MTLLFFYLFDVWWPTVPSDKGPPERNSKPDSRDMPAPPSPPPKESGRTAHRRRGGSGVALRLQPKVLQSSS